MKDPEDSSLDAHASNVNDVTDSRASFSIMNSTPNPTASSDFNTAVNPAQRSADPQTQLPRSSPPSPVKPNVATKPQITLVEFLRRAAEENLASLLEETDRKLSQATTESNDNRTPVMKSENPSRPKSPSNDPHSPNSTQHHAPRIGRRRNTPRSHKPRASVRRNVGAKRVRSGSSLGQQASNNQ